MIKRLRLIYDPQRVDCIANKIDDKTTVLFGNFSKATKQTIHRCRKDIRAAHPVPRFKRRGERGKARNVSDENRRRHLNRFGRVITRSLAAKLFKQVGGGGARFGKHSQGFTIAPQTGQGCWLCIRDHTRQARRSYRQSLRARTARLPSLLLLRRPH